jgi:hypothetical protein
MKRCILILCCVLGGTGTLFADGISLGFGLGKFGDDFTLQGSVTAPWFFSNHVTVRASGFCSFREGAAWESYGGLRAGVIGATYMSSADIRLYGEAGVAVVFPREQAGIDKVYFGGYGHFGFEFFMLQRGKGPAYYIEVGSNGIGIPAMNGFAASAGFRYYL